MTTGQANSDDYDLSVVIVNWNVADLLHGCLQALQSPEVSGGLRIQVIVVDNASTDSSVRKASTFPAVHTVVNETNIGYGRANNIGLALSRGAYILILNPDTIPLAGSLTAMLSFARSRPEAGIVAPRLLNADGSVQRSAFRFPTLAMSLLDLFPLPRFMPGRLRHLLSTSTLNGRYPNEPKATLPFRIDHPLGACMLLRRSAYEQAGGFDERIFMYSEEVDIAMRYWRAGWECWQVPSARVVHLGGQSTGQLPDKMLIELWRSRLYLSAKHSPGLRTVVLRLLLGAAQMKTLTLLNLAVRMHAMSVADAESQARIARSLLRLALHRAGR